MKKARTTGCVYPCARSHASVTAEKRYDDHYKRVLIFFPIIIIILFRGSCVEWQNSLAVSFGLCKCVGKTILFETAASSDRCATVAACLVYIYYVYYVYTHTPTRTHTHTLVYTLFVGMYTILLYIVRGYSVHTTTVVRAYMMMFNVCIKCKAISEHTHTTTRMYIFIVYTWYNSNHSSLITMRKSLVLHVITLPGSRSYPD